VINDSGAEVIVEWESILLQIDSGQVVPVPTIVNMIFVSKIFLDGLILTFPDEGLHWLPW
jgi:hypothetical protein